MRCRYSDDPVFLRFAIFRKDEDSHSSLGVFQAIFELRDSGELQDYELEIVESELGWLKMHLKSPAVLQEGWTERAISWFKPEAERPIEKIRTLNHILVEHGYFVKMLKTETPGRVIYEDGWQVVAIPFRDGEKF